MSCVLYSVVIRPVSMIAYDCNHGLDKRHEIVTEHDIYQYVQCTFKRPMPLL